MMNKRALEFSFTWLFAIIIGAFILFLAVFLASKIIKTSEYQLDITTAKQIGILLNPLETSFESSLSSYMILPKETRIYNSCDKGLNEFRAGSEIFGNQQLSLSQQGLANKWSAPGSNVTFHNKYIFSKDYVEGKKFYLFSQPYEYPFKIANLIFLSSSNDYYCFLNPPDDVETELTQINQENIGVNDCNSTGINGGSAVKKINVCFQQKTGCDILVNYQETNEGLVYGTVVKNKGKDQMRFTGSLMYGAIFSEKTNYECQTKRLMKRLYQLNDIYFKKSKLLATRECNTGMDQDLILLGNYAKSFENSEDFNIMNSQVEKINIKNEALRLSCSLW